MSTLERAIALAAEAHTGQLDKAGQPYILHPIRVMLSVQGEIERIAAVLHDVVEDTRWTIEELRQEGFSEPVLEAIALLTKPEGADYEDYVRRIKPHAIARAVKLADLADNSDLRRLVTVTPKDQARIEKYARARKILEE